MKLKKLAAVIGLSSCLMFTNNINATGIPTVDVANLVPSLTNAIANLEAQLVQYEQYVTQIDDLRNQYDQLVKLREQLVTAKETFGSITGLRNLGKLLNSDFLKRYRSSLPSEWQDDLDFTVGLVGEANEALRKYERTQTRLKYKKAFGDENWAKTASETYKTYKTLAVSTYQTETIAATALGTSEQTEKNVETFIAEIDKTEDLKASSDLTNRLLAENLALQNKLIQLQASVAMGQTGQYNFQFENEMKDRTLNNQELPDFSEVSFEGL